MARELAAKDAEIERLIKSRETWVNKHADDTATLNNHVSGLLDEIERLKAINQDVANAIGKQTRLIDEKDAEMERLRNRNAELLQLLGECVRNRYSEVACSPSWLEEARKAIE